MGSSVVDDLVHGGADEITIADINKESLDKVVGRIGKRGGKVKGVRVDVKDRAQLREVCQGADVVVNTVGPFYKFEEGVLNTIKDLDVGYVDICDDYDVTLNIFHKSKERNTSVKARMIVGMGWTPGITNVCARDGYESMDRVEEISIAWVGSAADATGKAVIEHVFHAVTGKVPMYLDGALTDVPARQFPREIEFPDPINKVEAYYTGHPEPITIPLFLRGVRNVTVRGALVPEWQNHLVSQFADVGLTEKRVVDVGGVKISAREFLVSFVHDTMDQFRVGGIGKSGFWVEVKGERKSKKTVIRYTGVDKMRRLTGVSAAIGAMFLADNTSLRGGIYAPEAVIDPSYLFTGLKERNIVLKKFIETEES